MHSPGENSPKDWISTDQPAPVETVEPITPGEDSDLVKRTLPAWIISIVVHLVVIGLLSLIVYATKVEIDEPPIKRTMQPPLPQREETQVERDLNSTDIHLDVEVESDTQSPVANLDIPVETVSREDENDADVARGREEAKADAEMGSEGVFMAIGAGGGGSGMFGSRSGGGKKRALGKFGGTKGSESAVDAALRWLKKHQSPNGMWDAVAYTANCTENPKCEPGEHGTWMTNPESTSIALTGYAVLCFLGAGYDQRMPSKYKATVKKGLDWLVAVQQADGRLGMTNYTNAIATMALAEAYAMSNDAQLRDPAQKGVDVILAAQCQDAPGGAKKDSDDSTGGTGLGWDYIKPSLRCDASVTGWNVMALKSARAGGLNVQQGMEGAHRWLVRTYQAANPDWKTLTDPYTSRAIFPYDYVTDSGKMTWLNPDLGGSVILQHGGVNLNCVGMVCAVFLGHHAGDPMLSSLTNEVMANQVPKAYPCNTYYMYYNTIGIFQVGGDTWKTWNGKVRDLLVQAQRKGDGCFDGSWDSQGTLFLGHKVGRMLSTVYCCLSLEVYYRYAQTAVKKDH